MPDDVVVQRTERIQLLRPSAMSRFSTCRLCVRHRGNRIATIARGRTLRLELTVPALVHWSLKHWRIFGDSKPDRPPLRMKGRPTTADAAKVRNGDGKISIANAYSRRMNTKNGAAICNWE